MADRIVMTFSEEELLAVLYYLAWCEKNAKERSGARFYQLQRATARISAAVS